MWGRYKQNGVWLARRSRFRLIVRRGHLYVAVGRLRLRLMRADGERHRERSS